MEQLNVVICYDECWVQSTQYLIQDFSWLEIVLKTPFLSQNKIHGFDSQFHCGTTPQTNLLVQPSHLCLKSWAALMIFMWNYELKTRFQAKKLWAQNLCIVRDCFMFIFKDKSPKESQLVSFTRPSNLILWYLFTNWWIFFNMIKSLWTD